MDLRSKLLTLEDNRRADNELEVAFQILSLGSVGNLKFGK